MRLISSAGFRLNLERGFFRALAILAVFLLIPSVCATAATPAYLPYPSTDSTVINPYGASDETALLLNALRVSYQAATGKNLNVRTVTGRGGASGWGELASQPGDGYNLAATNLQNVILRSMSRRPVFQLNDVYNVCVMAEAPLVLWVPASSPFTSIADLAASARAYPEQLIIAGAGSLTINHLASLQFNFFSGSKTVYLPYLGTTTAMQAVAMGQAHAAWGYPLADFGRQMGMRPLAVASSERLAQMPDVPTFDEAGIGLFAHSYFGLALPQSATPAIRQEVGNVMNDVISSPEFQNTIRTLGFTPLVVSGQALNQLVGEQVVSLGDLLKDYAME